MGLLVLDRDWLDQLYVEPSRTSQGIGSCLLGRQEATTERPQAVDLPGELGARRFYERHGFIAKETTEGKNEEGAPDIRFEWNGSGSEPAP